METDRKIILLADTEQSHQDKLRDFYTSFSNQIKDKGLEDSVALVRASDIGIYGKGFAVKIFPRGIVYTGVKESDIGAIIDASVKGQGTVERLLFSEEPKQIRIVLRNCGVIDPESIDEYIACRGYGALTKILLGMDPAGVIEEMKKSGLRGRGGAGYPTWMKWKFTRESQGDRKYVICNADEGDPGAYMDRSVLEGDPHSVIEGLIIAGYAIGAGRGYMYIRAEYPLAVERVKKAIEQAYECGLLGKNILGTDFSFDIDIRLGAGAFVCGEETALIASIEGKRGTPRPRPPYPSVSGLWGKPTATNNVRTLANVPDINLEGGD